MPDGVKGRERSRQILQLMDGEDASLPEPSQRRSEIGDAAQGRCAGAVEEGPRLAGLGEARACFLGLGLEERLEACAARLLVGVAACASARGTRMRAEALEQLGPLEAFEGAPRNLEGQRARIPVMCSPRISVWTSWVPS
jgi:hypothetical protein